MKKINYLSSIVFLLALPAFGFSQEANNETYFSNALFNTLLGIILFLLIVIIAFSNVMKNVVDSDYLTNKLKEEDQNSGSSAAKNLGVFALLLLGYDAMAQNSNSDLIGGIDQPTFYFLLSIIFIEVIVLGLLVYQFKFLMRSKKTETIVPSREESSFMSVLTDAVAIEEESSIMMEHEYDGIRELDNNLPPWWKYGFYFTIIFAFFYMVRYHISGEGDLQTAEYEKEMAQAKIDVEEYMKNSANKVDETTVTMLKEQKDLDAGKEIFISTCAACHGRLGEGGVGPNMADEYWIHGGSIQDIFKSIKYGWPEKGMKSWKEDLSPMQIAQVTSFIRTLKGTNPANGKPAQGDLYVESANKTTATDSTVVNLPSDSLKTNSTDTVTEHH